jgi:hypothetical protein
MAYSLGFPNDFIVKSAKSSAFLSLILVGLLFFAPTAQAQKVAALSNVKGEVEVSKEGKDRAIKGRDGAALFAQQVVRTVGADSMVDVVFEKGGAIRVMPNSELRLSQVDISGDKFNIGVDLKAGKIFNVVNKLSSGSTYVVRTETGTSGVKGTIYSAETAAGRTVFMVRDGKVEAANPAAPEKTVLVAELKKTVVEGAQPPSAPVPLTPEEIAMFDVLTDIMSQLHYDIREQIRQDIQENRIAPDMLGR